VKLVSLGLAAALLLLLGASAQGSTCSAERAACEVRCGTSHGLTGEKLAQCKQVSCQREWGKCLQSGVWVIGRTGQVKTGLQKQ